MSAAHALPAPLRAVAWMTLTLVSFLAMAVAARELAARMSTFEILTIRSALGLAILVVPALRARPIALRTARPRLHVARNLVHFAGQYGWIWAVGVLPLASVFALEFTVPMWVALIAVLLGRERVDARRILAIAGGFAGVLVILRPGAATIDPAALVVLGAALAFALSVHMVKTLTVTDRPLTILLYMTIVQLPLGLVPALPGWVAPTAADAPWLVVVAVTGLTAHWGLARALRLADAVYVAPLDFLRLPAIAVVGHALYAEALELWTFAGAALIFLSGYQVVWHESRRARRVPAPGDRAVD